MPSAACPSAAELETFAVGDLPEPAFGRVVNGMDVVDQMKAGDVIQRVRVWDGKGWQ